MLPKQIGTMSDTPSLARGEITELLVAWSEGDAAAAERLMPLVYGELKAMARRHVRRGGGDRTLQRTALVHEVYLRLIDQRVSWQNRAHFYGLAARMMRRIAIDDARRAGRHKRGAGTPRVPLELVPDIAGDAALEPVDAILLDSALTALEGLDTQAARIVELRFFGGLTIEETADVVGQSPSTIKREWAVARAWLHRRMTGGTEPAPGAAG